MLCLAQFPPGCTTQRKMRSRLAADISIRRTCSGGEAMHWRREMLLKISQSFLTPHSG